MSIVWSWGWRCSMESSHQTLLPVPQYLSSLPYKEIFSDFKATGPKSPGCPLVCHIYNGSNKTFDNESHVALPRQHVGGDGIVIAWGQLVHRLKKCFLQPPPIKKSQVQSWNHENTELYMNTRRPNQQEGHPLTKNWSRHLEKFVSLPASGEDPA